MARSSVHIVTELHDEPHIEGRRVTGRRIRGLVEDAGKSAEQVVADESTSAVTRFPYRNTRSAIQ